MYSPPVQTPPQKALQQEEGEHARAPPTQKGEEQDTFMCNCAEKAFGKNRLAFES